MRVIKVCVPNTHHDAFDYLATGEPPLRGARVLVPFRNKTRIGIVLGEGDADCAPKALKAIEQTLDTTPCMPEDVLRLCEWAAGYYQSPLSAVIPLALPKHLREGHAAAAEITEHVTLALNTVDAHAKIPARAGRQHALIDWLAAQATSVTQSAILAAGFNQTLIMRLKDAALLHTETRTEYPPVISAKAHPPPLLHPEQTIAIDSVRKAFGRFESFLLQGVTGSGKTEVYLQVIADVLARGQQALVLVPEIGLTPQLLARFAGRFKESMVVLHSSLSEGERRRAWLHARDGRARLIIGTRTAVFVPLQNPGLIVIDEEHDTSLKQMDGVRYSARDVALWRARQLSIPIILGSATPSLESLYNATRAKYQRLTLTQRAQSTAPTRFCIQDIRSLPLEHGLAKPTLARIREHLERGQQVLVFINRRGFAPVMLCHECGWMADCRACDSHLTLHRKSHRLQCHHCGASARIPSACPDCQSMDLVPVGNGTQRVFDYLQTCFPNVSMARIDRDEVRRKGELEAHLEKILQGETQLCVGTQMLAKGHHFPGLTLVVILDADNGLQNPDFRATERFGQLLTQVAGRAGREALAGEVLIQTHFPQHPLLNLLVREGYEAFAERLLSERREGLLPPYQYLALLRAEGREAAPVLAFLHEARRLLQHPALEIMGPAPAPLSRKAHQHRLQLLLRAPARRSLHEALAHLRNTLPPARALSGVRWSVDVDPVELS